MINVLEASANTAEICTPKCTPRGVESDRNSSQLTPETTPDRGDISAVFATACNKKAAPCNELQKAARWAISDSNHNSQHTENKGTYEIGGLKCTPKCTPAEKLTPDIERLKALLPIIPEEDRESFYKLMIEAVLNR